MREPNATHLRYNYDRNTAPVLLGDYCLIHRYVLLQRALELIFYIRKTCFPFLTKDELTFTYPPVLTAQMIYGYSISDHRLRREQR